MRAPNRSWRWDEARHRGPSTGPSLNKEAGERGRAARVLRQAAAEEAGVGQYEAEPPLARRGAAEESDHVLDAFEDPEDHVVREERRPRVGHVSFDPCAIGGGAADRSGLVVLTAARVHRLRNQHELDFFFDSTSFFLSEKQLGFIEYIGKVYRNGVHIMRSFQPHMSTRRKRNTKSS